MVTLKVKIKKRLEEEQQKSNIKTVKLYVLECKTAEGKPGRRVLFGMAQTHLYIKQVHTADDVKYLTKDIYCDMDNEQKDSWMKMLEDFVVFGKTEKGHWSEFASIKGGMNDKEKKQLEKIKLALEKKALLEGL